MAKTPFMMLVLLVCVTLRKASADDLSEIDVETNVSDEMESMKVERSTKYMSRNQIRNEFIRHYNQIEAMRKTLDSLTSGPDYTSFNSRMSTLKTDLATVSTNDETIGDTLQTTCGSLDTLLDSSTVDCCYTDYTVFCVPRSDLTDKDPSYDVTAGTCGVCPDFST